MFIRKACTNALATVQNICRRLGKGNSECMRYGSATESDKHVLFECSKHEVWKELGYKYKPKRNEFSCFKDWFAAFMLKVS